MNENIVPKNEKRIVKNTVALYFRMLVTVAITFFTTRELIVVLGVERFGAVNLISGIVTMFSFLSNTITTASSRFFNIAIGEKNKEKLSQLFSVTLYIYVILTVILLILCETIGYWIFYNKIDIPTELFEQSKYFFHFTVITFLLTVLTIPYTAITISREDMWFIATEAIVVAIAKLAVIYVLHLNAGGEMAFYGFLLVVIALFRFLAYLFYCAKMYEETRLVVYWNNKCAKELVVFGGWNIFGALLGLANGAILSILLNNFFGLVINTTRAISTQVSYGISSFAQNFIVATNPQIVKYWGSGDIDKSHRLTMLASKFAFFLMLILMLPILINTEFVLRLWLGRIPDYSVIFTRLLLIQILIDSLSYPLMSLFQATGKIAIYQVVVSFTVLLNLPISYVLFRWGFPPQSTLYVAIVISLICMVERIFLINRMANLPLGVYAKQVLCPVFMVAILSLVLSIGISRMDISGVIGFVLCSLGSVLSTALLVFMFGFSKQAQGFIISMLRKKFINDTNNR